MSLALYPLRIYWDGRAGSIRNRDAVRPLTAAPVLPADCGALRLVEIDYAPGTVAQLREHAGQMRDMTPAERAACDALIATIQASDEGDGHHG